MAKRRRESKGGERRGREFWLGVVADQASTGESTRAICERLGLNANTLNWWRWRLRQEESREFVGAPAAQFLPVRLVGEPVALEAPLEIVVSGGRTIRVPRGFPQQQLAEIVATLEALP